MVIADHEELKVLSLRRGNFTEWVTTILLRKFVDGIVQHISDAAFFQDDLELTGLQVVFVDKLCDLPKHIAVSPLRCECFQMPSLHIKSSCTGVLFRHTYLKPINSMFLPVLSLAHYNTEVKLCKGQKPGLTASYFVR